MTREQRREEFKQIDMYLRTHPGMSRAIACVLGLAVIGLLCILRIL